jgi:hypothetical protein
MGVECHLNPHAKHGNFSDCTATTPEDDHRRSKAVPGGGTAL